MNQKTKYIKTQYANGDKKYEGNYINGKKDGLHKEWYPKNQLKYEGSYIKGIKNGIHKAWYENGQIMYEGERDGLHKMWHQNGQMLYEGDYKNMEAPEGIIKFINMTLDQFGLPTENPDVHTFNFIPLLLSSIISESFKFLSTLFNDLSKKSLTSGPNKGMHKIWHENGQPMICFLINNKQKIDGFTKIWHENGQLAAEGSYKQGKKEGLWIYYYPNKQIQEKGQYKNNDKDGFWKNWSEDGKLQETKKFKHGHVDYSGWPKPL